MSNEKITTQVKKNPGRVASGKQLVEWNKKKKADLQVAEEVPNQVPSQVPEQVPSQVPSQVPTKSYDKYMIGGGILVVLAVGLLVYFKSSSSSSKNEVTAVSAQQVPKHDPFA